jgi:hypothetical protein
MERLADLRAGTSPARTPIPTASAKARVRTSGYTRNVAARGNIGVNMS